MTARIEREHDSPDAPEARRKRSKRARVIHTATPPQGEVPLPMPSTGEAKLRRSFRQTTASVHQADEAESGASGLGHRVESLERICAALQQDKDALEDELRAERAMRGKSPASPGSKATPSMADADSTVLALAETIAALRAQLEENQVVIELLRDDKRRLQELWYAPQKAENETILRGLLKQIDQVEEVEDWKIRGTERAVHAVDTAADLDVGRRSVRPPTRASSKANKENKPPALYVDTGKGDDSTKMALETSESRGTWGRVESWQPKRECPNTV